MLATSLVRCVGHGDDLDNPAVESWEPTWDIADSTQTRPRIAIKRMEVQVVDGRNEEICQKKRYERTQSQKTW